jgi:dolichyl-phosphate-mannose--protein O-mannosyl transferase
MDELKHTHSYDLHKLRHEKEESELQLNRKHDEVAEQKNQEISGLKQEMKKATSEYETKLIEVCKHLYLELNFAPTPTEHTDKSTG